MNRIGKASVLVTFSWMVLPACGGAPPKDPVVGSESPPISVIIPQTNVAPAHPDPSAPSSTEPLAKPAEPVVCSWTYGRSTTADPWNVAFGATDAAEAKRADTFVAMARGRLDAFSSLKFWLEGSASNYGSEKSVMTVAAFAYPIFYSTKVVKLTPVRLIDTGVPLRPIAFDGKGQMTVETALDENGKTATLTAPCVDFAPTRTVLDPFVELGSTREKFTKQKALTIAKNSAVKVYANEKDAEAADQVPPQSDAHAYVLARGKVRSKVAVDADGAMFIGYVDNTAIGGPLVKKKVVNSQVVGTGILGLFRDDKSGNLSELVTQRHRMLICKNPIALFWRIDVSHGLQVGELTFGNVPLAFEASPANVLESKKLFVDLAMYNFPLQGLNLVVRSSDLKDCQASNTGN